MQGSLEHVNRSDVAVTASPPSPHFPRRGNGYVGLYEPGEFNRCPGCGNSHWYVGRTTAECAFCSTALPLADMSCLAFALPEALPETQPCSRSRRAVSIDATNESAGRQHFTGFPSVPVNRSNGDHHLPDSGTEAAKLADESIYYSRRAREEESAAKNASCSRSRNLHLELAQAYEFRAHVVTQQLLQRDTNLLLCAL